MDIVKDYKKVIEITLGEVVASPDFFVSVGAIDYGYIIAPPSIPLLRVASQ